MRRLDGITDPIDMSKFHEIVKNRKAWYAAVHEVAKSDKAEEWQEAGREVGAENDFSSYSVDVFFVS